MLLHPRHSQLHAALVVRRQHDLDVLSRGDLVDYVRDGFIVRLVGVFDRVVDGVVRAGLFCMLTLLKV